MTDRAPRTSLRRLALPLLCVVAMFVLTFVAPTRAASAGVKIRPLDWQIASIGSVVSPGGQVLAAGDDVVIQPPVGQTDTLINATTSQTTDVTAPSGCAVNLAGMVFVLYECTVDDQSAELLYSTTSHQWTAPNPTPIHTYCANEHADCRAVQIGSDWIEWDAGTCTSDGSKCIDHDVYENVATGELNTSSAVPGTRTWYDVNSPGLRRTLCAPLRIPSFYSDYDGPVAGSIQFFGPYALVDQNSSSDTGGEYLEKCGTRLHQFVESPLRTDSPVSGNGHLLIWSSSLTTISYETLPAGKRGIWTLPTDLSGAEDVTVVGDRLFLEHVDLWNAKLPAGL